MSTDVLAATDKQITVSWLKPSDLGGNRAQLSGYWVKYGPKGDLGSPIKVPADSTSFTLEEAFILGNEYDFQVRASNVIGDSAYTSVLSVLAARTPSAPLNLVKDAAKSTGYELGLTWETPESENGSAITSYIIWSNKQNPGV